MGRGAPLSSGRWASLTVPVHGARDVAIRSTGAGSRCARKRRDDGDGHRHGERTRRGWRVLGGHQNTPGTWRHATHVVRIHRSQLAPAATVGLEVRGALSKRSAPTTNSLGRGGSGCRIASSQGTEHAGRGGSDGDEETEATSSNRNRRDHEAQAEEEDLAREIAQRPACAGPARVPARRRRLHARSLAAYSTLFGR